MSALFLIMSMNDTKFVEAHMPHWCYAMTHDLFRDAFGKGELVEAIGIDEESSPFCGTTHFIWLPGTYMVLEIPEVRTRNMITVSFGSLVFGKSAHQLNNHQGS